MVVLVNVPVFSAQSAAGSTTSASRAVSVGKASCTTTNSRSCRMRRTRCSSGSETTGLVAMIHRNLIAPVSARRKSWRACVGGPQAGIVCGATFQIRASS